MSLNKALKYFLITAVYLLQLNSFSQDKTIDSLKLALKNAKHDTTRCIILNILAETANDDEWPVFNEQLRVLAEKNSNNGSKLKNFYLKYLASALNNIGFLEDLYGNNAKALKYHSASLKISTEIRNKGGMSASYSNMGNVYLRLGDLNKSFNYYNEALKINVELADTIGISWCMQSIGLISERKGDIIKAMEYYHSGLKLSEKIKNKQGIALCLQYIGSVLYYQGDVVQALDYYSRSLKIQEEIGNKDGMALSLNNIGLIYYDQRNYEKALEFHLKSLAMRKEAGNKLETAISLSNIGNVYSRLGDIQKALEYLQSALSIQQEVADKRGIALTLTNIAIQYFNKGEISNALNYGNKSLKVARELGFPSIIKSAAHSLKLVFEKQHKYEQAFEMFDLEIKMRDSIKNQETQKAAVKKQLQYTYEKKEAVAKKEHEKKLEKQQAIANEKQRKQNIIIWSVVVGLILVIGFAGYVFKTLSVTRRQKLTIEIKSREVEEKQREILDSIHYAKRIQAAQIPTEKYIHKSLNRLKRKG